MDSSFKLTYGNKFLLSVILSLLTRIHFSSETNMQIAKPFSGSSKNMQHWNKVWLVVMVLLLKEGMANMTKATYSLKICFFLITFKANNEDFYLFFRNIFVNGIIRYILRFLHNSIKWETNCAAHEQATKTWKLTISSTANYITCHGLPFCVGSECFMLLTTLR